MRVKLMTVIGAFLFAVMVLSMVAPLVVADPLPVLIALMIGVFIGMLIQSQECQ